MVSGGVKTLIKSWCKTKPEFPMYVMMPDRCKNSDLHSEVLKLGMEIIFAPDIEIQSDHIKNNKISHWNETFFKLNIAHLNQFSKIIFLDADMIVLRNIDHLFNYPSISATTGGKTAHPEWTEFNSGIMVLEPSDSFFHGLLNSIVPAIERKIALDLGYGDQDVFNQYCSGWIQGSDHDFGEQYNVEHCFVDEYMKATGFKNFEEIYVFHFIGGNKIWNKNIVQLIRMFHGLVHDGKFYEIKACLLYLKYLHF